MGTERRVISLDPGKRALGWAAWVDCEFLAAGLARTPKGMDSVGELAAHLATQIPRGASEVVCEGMLVQHGRTFDPADMLACQAIGCFVSGHLHPARFTLTNGTAWKMNRPKEIQHKLDFAALFPWEAVRLNRFLEPIPPTLRHNVLDAVGIGLSYLKADRRGIKHAEAKPRPYCEPTSRPRKRTTPNP